MREEDFNENRTLLEKYGLCVFDNIIESLEDDL